MSAAFIRKRAKRLRRVGEFIGLFDWVVWGVQHQVNVLMLFGSNVVDIKEWFAPGMPQRFLSCLRVAAVRAVGGRWLSAVGPGPNVNHFVLGVACIRGKDRPVPDARPDQMAVKAAMRAGWILRPTNSTGDCGIDAMSHHFSQPREAATWLAIRNHIADHMVRIADDPAWHAVYYACQERQIADAPRWRGGIGAHPPGTSPLGSLTAAASLSCAASHSGSSSSGLAPSERVASSSIIAASQPGPAASAIAASEPESAPLVPVDLPPLPPPAHDAPDTDVVVATTVAGPRAFADWISDQSVDQLRMMTSSVTMFVGAEARWRAEHPAHSSANTGPRRRQNVASEVNFKHATGTAFMEWRKGVGHDTRAPHKDRYYNGRPSTDNIRCYSHRVRMLLVYEVGCGSGERQGWILAGGRGDDIHVKSFTLVWPDAIREYMGGER
jgi:hypothetical protein